MIEGIIITIKTIWIRTVIKDHDKWKFGGDYDIYSIKILFSKE